MFQRSPRIRLRSRTPSADAAEQTEDGVEVPPHVGDVDVEERVVEALGVRDLHLPPKLPRSITGRVAHHQSGERFTDEPQAHQTEEERGFACHAGWRTDEREP